MIELTKIMRQKDDHAFIAILNRIRTFSQTEDDIALQSRSITSSDPFYPTDALHIWAENAPVDEHNSKKIEELAGTLHILKQMINIQRILESKISIGYYKKAGPRLVD